MIGYKLTRSTCNGWLFLGTTPSEVAQAIRDEIESVEGLSIDELDEMKIEPFEITQEEIDRMPEFPGW